MEKLVTENASPCSALLAELEVKYKSLYAEMEDAWREVDRATRDAEHAEEEYLKAQDEYDAEKARCSANGPS